MIKVWSCGPNLAKHLRCGLVHPYSAKNSHARLTSSICLSPIGVNENNVFKWLVPLGPECLLEVKGHPAPRRNVFSTLKKWTGHSGDLDSIHSFTTVLLCDLDQFTSPVCVSPFVLSIKLWTLQVSDILLWCAYTHTCSKKGSGGSAVIQIRVIVNKTNGKNTCAINLEWKFVKQKKKQHTIVKGNVFNCEGPFFAKVSLLSILADSSWLLNAFTFLFRICVAFCDVIARKT